MGKKVLVADDSVTIQKVIKLALSSEGYDILAVSDGKEAIRAIAEERPDVVLIDVALPRADAYEVKRTISKDASLSAIGFVLMASAFERVDDHAVEESGFHGRLIKPFDPSHLRRAVSDLIKKMSVASVAQPIAPDEASDVSVEQAHDLPSMPREGEPLPQIHDLDLSPPLSSRIAVEDLPPVEDMQPTVAVPEADTQVTEEEFNLNISADAVPVRQLEDEEAEDVVDDENVSDEVAQDRALESDIKNLTESTIKMSGLDDFQWSLDDSRKMKASSSKSSGLPPSPPPFTPPLAAGPPAVPTQDQSDALDVTRPIYADQRGAPLKSVLSMPARAVDDGGSTFPIKGAVASSQKAIELSTPEERGGLRVPPPTAPTRTVAVTIPPPQSMSQQQQTPSIASTPTPTIEVSLSSHASQTGARAPGLAISRDELEEMLRRDLRDVIEKVARDAVPEIAERIIRKEIERILAEP